MMWTLRDIFPLHYIVFKQMASHIPHEANVEQVFSRAGLLADPNLDTTHLATFVRVAVNKKAFKPSVKQIKEMYYAKFRGAAKEAPAVGEAGPSGVK